MPGTDGPREAPRDVVCDVVLDSRCDGWRRRCVAGCIALACTLLMPAAAIGGDDGSARISVGRAMGLHQVADPLKLRSAVALVYDQDSGEILVEKNSNVILPIASITKLMTALVVIEADLPRDEPLTISAEDRDTEKRSPSYLSIGTRLTRAEMLQLALMASENRAANALGRHYPGGLPAFVAAMNAKARALGMRDTVFVEPTGLSSRNVSSAPDLMRLMQAAMRHDEIRRYSTARSLSVRLRRGTRTFANTNRMLANQRWDIGLSKTGYISEAGNCLVMQAQVDGRRLMMVFLDSFGKLSRFGDAGRVRDWLGKRHDHERETRARLRQPDAADS